MLVLDKNGAKHDQSLSIKDYLIIINHYLFNQSGSPLIGVNHCRVQNSAKAREIGEDVLFEAWASSKKCPGVLRATINEPVV